MKKNNTDLLKNLFIFDAHCDTANPLLAPSFDFRKNKYHHVDLEKIRRGGLNAQIFALYVNPVYAPHRSIKRTLLLYHILQKKIFSPGYGRKVTSTIEMKSALKENKLACWLSLEGGHAIENSLEILEMYYFLGIRCMTLTHSKNTDWADSSAEAPRWDGLNSLGRTIVTHMEKMGMAIDVSHASDKTVEDVLDTVSTPIMASHSNARALCDIPRNLPNDLIQEIAERNGYIGVNFFPVFLKKSIYDQVSANVKKYEHTHQQILQRKHNPDSINTAEAKLFQKYVQGSDRADVNAVIDHIEHIANIGGVDCVGLGSDYDGINSTLSNMTDVSCYPTLLQGLIARGFTEKDIRKIMGQNLYHFLTQFDHRVKER
ncbi:MAG: dipeptidase [Candidatus Thermoplasmatota archaeon]|nr:dipeptidase [Candidatus Thermoplasmatota archaeon]